MASRPQFGIFGIPVKIDPFFAIMLLLFGFLMYAPTGGQYVVSFAVIAALSVFIHELGHALGFKAFGIRPSILLHGMGGATSPTSSTEAITPLRNIVITLAGPLPPLVLLGLPALSMATSSGQGSNVILEQIVFVNVVWSVLNLIPILPLDGGVVTASIFELIFAGKGRRIANVLSLVLASGLALYSFALDLPFLAVMAVLFGFLNVREMTTSRGTGQSSAGSALHAAHQALLNGQPQTAEYLAHQAVLEARNLEEQRWGHELMAWSRMFSGDVKGAEQLAIVMAPSRPPSQSILGSLALSSGRRDEGISVLAWSIAHEPAGPAKSLGAVAAARAGVTFEVAEELRAMGPQGGEPLRMLSQLLDHAGFHEQAIAVATGRRSAPEAYGASSGFGDRHDAHPELLDPYAGSGTGAAALDGHERSPGASSPWQRGSRSGTSQARSAASPRWPEPPAPPAPGPPHRPAPPGDAPSAWPRQPPAGPPTN